MAENIPKIIHCVWIGGGNITKVKSLEGIKSWLDKTDYAVWIWWDDAHVFSSEVRTQMNKGAEKPARREFDNTLQEKDPIRKNAAPGRDIHNLRFLLRETQDPDIQLKKTLALINQTQDALQPLRDLAKNSNGRVKLCNIRKHEFLPGQMDWMNRDLYDLEMTERGMFFAAASDILRYEILYNFGGVYMDVDLQLTGDLGQLKVQKDGMLAAIEDDKKGRMYSGKPWKGREKIWVAGHQQQCFYVMNNIVASHPESKCIQSLREAIRLTFDVILLKNAKARMDLDPNGELGFYRKAKITGSTLDMTGPNLVRDVLYLWSLGTPWQWRAAKTVERLVPEVYLLNRHQTPEAPHARTAMVWRDDDEAHQTFWKCVAEYACFPMGPVNWKTADAEKSDCKKAGTQVLKEQKSVQLL